MEARQTLRVMAVPFSTGTVLLPNSAVVEVLPFAPALPVENAPPWVLGNLLWRARPIPLISLERLFYDQRPETPVRSRIVIVNTLSEDPRLANFGFIATDVPRAFELGPEQLAPDQEALPGKGILTGVRVGEETMVIPDLEKLEQWIAEFIK